MERKEKISLLVKLATGQPMPPKQLIILEIKKRYWLDDQEITPDEFDRYCKSDKYEVIKLIQAKHPRRKKATIVQAPEKPVSKAIQEDFIL